MLNDDVIYLLHGKRSLKWQHKGKQMKEKMNKMAPEHAN